MVGLLYLPRLFVYHSRSEILSIQSETFKIMERRLLNVIMMPSVTLVFTSGLLLVYINNYLIYEVFFQTKAGLVFILGYTHGKFSLMAKDLELDFRKHKDIYYRVWNEVPTCVMIVIVLLIIIRPF